jgi:hypothetical protein
MEKLVKPNLVSTYKKFKLKQISFDIAKTIVESHPQINQVQLIAHSAQINWRQLQSTNQSKSKDILGALHQERPNTILLTERSDFLNMSIDELVGLNHGVWSITSKVVLRDDSIAHLPMMNFHPEDGVTIEDIEALIKAISGNKPGVILSSGRYFHYYGNYLLSPSEWKSFMSKFLMPCVFVSPRYIGHRLQDSYATLRLTSDARFKPTIPYAIKLL